MESRSPTNVQPFEVLKQIGEGGYGSVYLVKHHKYGEVALKKLRASNDIGHNDLDNLRREAEILSNLQHPNIVMLYEGQFGSAFCGLFLQYEKFGSVESFVEQFTVTNGWKMQIMFDISSAMCYLHGQQPAIIHGDLKCQNILIGEDYHAKICDFGLARIHTISKSKTSKDVNGTLEYIAPEYFQEPRRIKNEKFDVYAFAISVWGIFYQQEAYYDFCDKRIIPVRVERGDRPTMEDDTIPEAVQIIIRDCWHQNDKERPTFDCIKYGLHVQLALIRNAIIQPVRNFPGQEQQTPQHSSNKVTNTNSIHAIRRLRHARDPKLIQKIYFESRVLGINVVGQEIFVVCANSNKVLVHDAETSEFKLKVPVPGLTNPGSIAATGNALYISEFMGEDIYKVEMLHGKFIPHHTPWTLRGSMFIRLSITKQGRVLASCDRLEGKFGRSFKLCEYTIDGKMIKEILLPSVIESLRHAVQIDDGRYLITYSSTLSLIDENGALMKTWIGEDLTDPREFVVDQDGFIIVACGYADKVVLLNSELEYIKDIIPPYLLGRQISIIGLDKYNGKLYLPFHGGEIQVFLL